MKYLAALFLLAALAAPARAHDVAAASLDVRELAPGRVAITLDTATRGLGIVLPDGCATDGAPAVADTARSVTTTWLATCDLRGRRLAVRFGDARVDVLARVQLRDGTAVSGVLHRDAPSLTIATTDAGSVARDYAVLGIEHILLGWDHVLLVIGLVLLVRTRRALVTTLTAFTVGHSATLALATLGVVAVPVAPIEAVIALSLAFVAAEASRPAPARSRAPGYALAFGLLHGFGFAGALTDIGLPAGDVPLALVSFNVGVELGQLAIAALAALAIARAPRLAPRAATYAIGSLGVFWCLVRISQF